jgi:lipopolysaccharide biosynthesis glycosyltransferase
MKTAVTSMCIGEANRPMRNLTFPTLLDYADKIGADFINITAGFGERFLGIVYYEKLQIIGLLEMYDRVIFIDADVIVSPDCPCLLDLVPADHFGAFIASRYSDFHNQANIEIQKTMGEIEWRREQRDSRIFESFNSGVMVLSKQHLPELKQALPAADIWCRYPGPPVDPRTFLNDQTVLNYIVQKHQIPISDLTYRFNHTNARGHSTDRFSSYMIHYAGSSHRKSKRLITSSKLTKMKVDAAILSYPWLHAMVKKWPQLVGVLDSVV